MTPSTKRFSSIFDLGTQNLLPKICTKSPKSWLVWQIDRRCLGLPGGFRGWPIQWNHAKCCGTDHCCHGNKIWARCGDPVAYRLVYFPVHFLCMHHLMVVNVMTHTPSRSQCLPVVKVKQTSLELLRHLQLRHHLALAPNAF